MKKRNIINLIKYYSEGNDISFRNEARMIASYFDKNGDEELAMYIISLLSDANVFVPQIDVNELNFLKLKKFSTSSIYLPEEIEKDFYGILNAINKNIGINKFLFVGKPGTGKTETVNHLARILNKDIYEIETNKLIDSKLGESNKNIEKMFKEINGLPNKNKLIILFDEIDSIALDRINSNDLREMGRVTSEFLKGLDNLSEDIIVIATTNLHSYLDSAFKRRFNFTLDFDRYNKDDLIEIGEKLLISNLDKNKEYRLNSRLFKKILELSDNLPMPAELSNIIKISIAFSGIGEYEYLKKIFEKFINKKLDENIINYLKENKFTVREIEILTNISKSTISRVK